MVQKKNENTWKLGLRKRLAQSLNVNVLEQSYRFI